MSLFAQDDFLAVDIFIPIDPRSGADAKGVWPTQAKGHVLDETPAGWLVQSSNPACVMELFYPKFAWRRIPAAQGDAAASGCARCGDDTATERCWHPSCPLAPRTSD